MSFDLFSCKLCQIAQIRLVLAAAEPSSDAFAYSIYIGRFLSFFSNMNVVCEWDAGVSPALDRVKAGPGRVLFLVCDKGDKEVHVEYEAEGVEFSDAGLEEHILSRLPENEHRFVVFSFDLHKDHAHAEAESTSSIFWMHWSPGQGVPVSVTRMYSATKERMRVNMDGLRECVLSDASEFSRKWVEEKAARLNK